MVRYIWGVYQGEVHMGSLSGWGTDGEFIMVGYIWGVYYGEVHMGSLLWWGTCGEFIRVGYMGYMYIFLVGVHMGSLA